MNLLSQVILQKDYRYISLDTQAYPFQDAIGHIHAEAIGALYRKGIITGYEDGSFRPDARILKHHAAAMISRAFSFSTNGRYEPLDDVDVSHSNYGAIHYLHMAHIFSSPCHKFYPNSHLTYVEVTNLCTQIVYQLLGPAFVNQLQFPSLLESKTIVNRAEFAALLLLTKSFIEKNAYSILRKFNAL